jgi:hypothetical protein
MCPLCLDPQTIFHVVLKCDQKKAFSNGKGPPTFFFTYLSYRQWQETEDLLDALKAAGYRLDKALGKRIYELLERNLVGWENLPIPFVPGPVGQKDLEAVTCIDDAMELLHAARRQCELSEDDLKNSPSPSPTSAAASAEDVAESPTPAETDPAPASP